MSEFRLSALSDLARSISDRKSASPESSYTAKLLLQGTEKCAKKLGEEAIEVVLASMTGDKNHLIAESADLIYHLLVLLEVSGAGMEDVMRELERRRGISGIAEKASRPQI